jgi:hypothetical protein
MLPDPVKDPTRRYYTTRFNWYILVLNYFVGKCKVGRHISLNATVFLYRGQVARANNGAGHMDMSKLTLKLTEHQAETRTCCTCHYCRLAKK